MILTNSRNRKITILNEYFKTSNDPERGIALAVLTNNLNLKNVKISKIKEIVKKEVDENLFELSYDYVGDLAETISLIWPNKLRGAVPNLNELLMHLGNSKENKINDLIRYFLSIFSEDERWAFIKLVSGGLRIGVSSKLTKLALIHNSNIEISEIEKIWHGLEPPYLSLFDWIYKNGKKPKIEISKVFHPLMLAHPLEEKHFYEFKVEDFLAEWKWDGIRVQLILYNSKIKLFSRTGDDITCSFPEFKYNDKNLVVLDGELLVGKNFNPLNFNNLQQRLNRKKVLASHLEKFPAFVKLYDILFLDKKDLRNLCFIKRRKILKQWHLKNKHKLFDLSEIISFESWNELKSLKSKDPKKDIHEGLMIKKKSSLYVSGRPKGYWFKWKKDPMVADVIMMYAQRGHGKRSSYYSDFTFGLWKKNEIVPICKAYFGFSDQELKTLDKFVRNNTINRFGPVREVKKEFVVEIAFDSVDFSNRHKSGIALRFPRIRRLRPDKPINEVIQLSTFKRDFINN